MVLAAILLLAAFPQPKDAVRTAPETPAAVEAASSDSTLADAQKNEKAPAVELTAKAETVAPMNVSYAPGQPVLTPVVRGAESPAAAAEPIAPPSKPFAAIRPASALRRPMETPRQRHIWYALMASGHGAATFDAWSTRRALSHNVGTEGNPLLRPFAHGNGLYLATQASPALMDYLGRRMMTSRHPLIRRLWWLPQTAGAGFSFAAGIHNAGLVH